MSISRRNEKTFYISEFIAGLIFHMPVWVAYELQFITLGQLALIEAIMQGSQLLSELPTGAVADLVGKRASVFIGRILNVIGLVMYANARDFPAFVIYAIVIGIGDSFISGAKDAMIYDSLKEDGREKEYPKVNAKGSMLFQFSFVGAIFIGGILSIWGYLVAIYAYIAAIAVNMFLTFMFQEPGIDTRTFTLPAYLDQMRTGFMEIFKTPYIRTISLFYIGVGGITWAGMMIFNTSLLTTIGYSTLEIGLIVAAIRFFNSFVLFKSVNMTKIVTKKRVYLFFPAIMIASYLPGLFLTKQLAVLAVAGSIFASSARWVILGAYVNEQYDSRYRATALSALSMLVSLAVVGFALISSPVMAHFGGVGAMYTLMGLVSLVVVLPLGLRIQRRYHA